MYQTQKTSTMKNLRRCHHLSIKDYDLRLKSTFKYSNNTGTFRVLLGRRAQLVNNGKCWVAGRNSGVQLLMASTKQAEDDDEDIEDFNLQSPPPYDVSEKIREANRLLEEDETPLDKLKSPRVKFKEQIIEFEVEICDVSSDEAASTDDWTSPQLNENNTSKEKSLLTSDSDSDDTSLMPLEEDVKQGFPHEATYRGDDESPTDDNELDPQDATPLVIMVPRDLHSVCISPSEASDELVPTVTFAASSPISDDIPDTCDGLSLSTDNATSKLAPDSPVTELDLSEEFQLSLDLNKEHIIEEDTVKASNKLAIQSFPRNDLNNDLVVAENSSKLAKRKDSLKIQHYRKSIEGSISSEWNQFETVTDGLTPRDLNPDQQVDKQERPSSSRGDITANVAKCVRERPWTAPSRRDVCGSKWSYAQLPHYNGMRSEYGLSQEQLEERTRISKQLAQEKREQARGKLEDEARRREQNERVFRAWLARKQAENALLYVNNDQMHDPRLSAKLRKQQAEESFKTWLQRKKQERRARQQALERQVSMRHHLAYTPEQSHAAFKQWVKSKRKPRCKNLEKRLVLDNDPASLEKILNKLDPHTQSTFRIYLGVSKIEIRHKKKKVS